MKHFFDFDESALVFCVNLKAKVIRITVIITVIINEWYWWESGTNCRQWIEQN